MRKQKGHLVIVRDRFGKTVATGRLDNSPDIQCTEAACALQCIFRQPRFMFILLWWSQAKGSAKGCAISHESTTAVYGNGEPFMLIGCERIRAPYALVKRRNVLIQDAESAIGSINVQPEPLLVAQISKVIKWINRSGLHGSGGRCNTKRP